MKKSPRFLGTPLLVMVLCAVFIVMIFAGRCGSQQEIVIVSDTIAVDSTYNLSVSTRNRHQKSSRSKKSVKKTPQNRQIKQRNYLLERVDSVN